MQSILTVTNLTKTFDANEEVLKDITFSLTPGTFTAILGPSGCGKTTLLNLLSGLMKPTSGDISWFGHSIIGFSPSQLAECKRCFIGHIFQNHLLLNHLTVKENIEMGLNLRSASIPFDHLTHLLDINPLLSCFPDELSSSQKQLVSLARAMIKKPKILFCDEATGALNEANNKKIIALLHVLKEQFDMTILFATHNPQIAQTADRIITLKDGQILQDQPNSNPISAEDMIWG